MASIHKKLGKSDNAFITSGKTEAISNKHYKIHHRALQKCERLYSNDWIDAYIIDDDTDHTKNIMTGINKKQWKVHDCDGFDYYKDCN